MAISIPESLRDALRDAEFNISIELPNPKIATKADKDGSLSLEASYDIGEIYKTASNVANAIYEAVDNAVIDELLELNGYIKERTCRNVAAEGVLFECSECGAKTVDAVGNYTQKYCASCGAKVVDE